MAGPSIEKLFLQPLLGLLAEDGIKPWQLFSMPEVQALSSRDIKSFKPTEMLSVLQAAVALSNDPMLMLRLGRKVEITSLGTFGFGLMSSANLEEALKLYLRYAALVGPGPSFKVLRANPRLLLSLQLYFNTKRSARGRRQIGRTLSSLVRHRRTPSSRKRAEFWESLTKKLA